MTDEARTRTGATADEGSRRVTQPQRSESSRKMTPKTATPTESTRVATTDNSAPSSVDAPKPPPEASPRNGIAVNVASVTTAFHAGARSRSVRGIQVALTERGFAPGNVEGLVDYDTRAAYAKFQRDVGERPTGIPTADSLDILGFDVVG